MALLAALMGLFAMHGLSDHGTMRHDVMTHSPALTSPVTSEMAGMAGVTHASHDAVAALGARPVAASVTEAVASVEAGSLTRTGSMGVSLCVAVLVGLVLVLVTRSRPWPGVLPRQALARTHGGSSARARDPDPPDLVTLSIHRC